MAPTDDGPPLSLRPFPVADTKPKNIADFIARVNLQPGGFRALSEEKLEEELGRGIGNLENDEDVEMSDGDRGEQDDEDGITDPNAARMEVLKNIDIAGNTAMLTLDSLSLLLSKQNPTQASVTLSQQLRDMVGIGTLGADKLDDSNVTPAKSKAQEEVAIGWTLTEINKTRDAAESACAFLTKEVEAEKTYWEDIVKVQKAGWSLCKVPQERHTIGVRFGFSEAAPEFKNNGLAPMRQGDGGSVQLDVGRLGGVSERVMVTYEQDGKIIGKSSLPAQTTDDAPLEARVLEARNTIFAQELWYELSREARSLVSYDVRPQGSQLICQIDKSSRISLELVPLSSSPSNEELPANFIAESISMSLHLLLSFAHRSNELSRIRPMPPHVPRSRNQQTYPLLRPVITRMMSLRQVEACTTYISGLIRTLKNAGLKSSFTLQTPQSVFPDPGTHAPNQPSPSQTLIRNLLSPIEFQIEIIIMPGATFSVRARTFLFPITTTHYNVSLPQSPPSTIQDACPPYKDGYPDLASLCDYLRTATARVLTKHMLARLTDAPPSDLAPKPYSKTEWIENIKGTSIRALDKEEFEIHFAIVDESSSSSETSTNTRAAGASRTPSLHISGTTWKTSPAASTDANGPQPPTLETVSFTWQPDGGEKRSLHDVMGKMFGQALI